MNIVLTVQDSFFFWPVVHDKLLQLPVNLEWCFFVRLCCSLQSFFAVFLSLHIQNMSILEFRMWDIRIRFIIEFKLWHSVYFSQLF